ncbi:serine/threonine-protein kinase [Streptomyces sp. W16]|uniref:serine/threonine-protein kinase n=1 Tax=Streptomyces sp. W16 TaxID=3076631 RepID=UPI00295B0D92|nr:serine/threonine-protein kinase [Streptomyces sp. W16]MDV9173494.1 serine/threonine-protein kinase [Streptomyces sp. W16]
MGTEGDNVRVIAGRYRLEKRLGRGGMGVVWRATDQLLGRQVAVKEIAQDDSLSEEEARQHRDRTLREARAVAQLRHPHVIVVHDVVEQDERPYIVMELIDGGSLADRISTHGPVDAAEAARIGIALLGALRTAHAAGVLHRDIKPANVLLDTASEQTDRTPADRSGSDRTAAAQEDQDPAAFARVVLTDFGIAQVAGATTLTENGAFVGSPEYTAPERMSGLRTGPASDLWSLGALLCTVLSGESPFRRDSLGGILHAVVFDEIRPPEEARPLLPVVRGLLERDPEQRLEAAEAERMLRAFLKTGRTPSAGAGRTPKAGAGRTAHPAPGYTPTQRDVPLRESAPPTPSPTPPVTEVPPPRRSTRGVLVAALLVAAMAGAGVSAAALLMHGDDNRAAAPGSSAPSTSTSAGTTSPSPTPTPTPTPSKTVNSPTAPSGYRVAHDPDGFALAVPEDFVRVPQGERIFYMSPGETFRLGIRMSDPAAGGPLAVMKSAAAKGADTNPGYHDGKVTDTTHYGHPAALWEFTWNGFSTAEGPRHTYDLCWEESGRMYDVWVSAPVGKVREAKEYFDVALDTFVPAQR